ncbi:YwmB family TATA-box binding protein [Clostridium sediminicola]|uniref:YwmB family TATA-box binding protein n=1 Tax=Clostridium sediminicola TaxID=3114879 RepID=UPI0031F22DFB
MDKKKVVFVCLFIVIVLTNYKVSFAERKVHLFDSILAETNTKVIEYGIDEKFQTTNGNISIDNLINLFDDKLFNYSTKIIDTEDVYRMEFNSKNGTGFISVVPYESKYLYHISILIYDDNIKIDDIENDLKGFTRNYNIENAIYYIYAKAKLDKDIDIEEYNNKIIDLLKNYGSTNVKTVSINNGFSTIANTHQFNGKKSNGKFIDFNFATCNYESGNYLIMGTPEIIKTY